MSSRCILPYLGPQCTCQMPYRQLLPCNWAQQRSRLLRRRLLRNAGLVVPCHGPSGCLLPHLWSFSVHLLQPRAVLPHDRLNDWVQLPRWYLLSCQWHVSPRRVHCNLLLPLFWTEYCNRMHGRIFLREHWIVHCHSLHPWLVLPYRRLVELRELYPRKVLPHHQPSGACQLSDGQLLPHRWPLGRRRLRDRQLLCGYGHDRLCLLPQGKLLHWNGPFH